MTFPIHLTGLAKRAVCATRQPPVHLFSRPERPATCQPRARSTGNGTLPKRKGTHRQRARPTDFWLWAYSAPGAVTTSRRGHSRYSALHTGRLQARQRRVKLIRYGQGDLHWATDNNPIRDAVRTTLPIGSPDIYDSYLKQIIPRWCD